MLTPIGVPGELYIGGDGLARGYLNRPELNKERFIDNPFATEEDKKQGRNLKLYKTGDLVRYLEDGNIEYIGRNDFQVKIRGFRIELGEIESALLTHSEVKQVVVIAREDAPGDKRLIAYVVYANEPVKFNALYNFLKKSLPDYMIPAAFVALEVLPITPNGKIDRKILPKPNFVTLKGLIPPRNDFEKRICNIWAETLGLSEDKINVTDDFFELGGNSILTIKLVSQINQMYGSCLKVVDVFSNRTVESISNKVFQTKNCYYQAIVKLNNTSRKPNLFMIHPGLAGCEVYSSLARRFFEHYSCYGVDSYNLYNANKISVIDKLAEYYLLRIDEIMAITQQGYYHLLGWSLGGRIALEIAAILERKGVNKIKVYLLDSMIMDRYMKSLLATISIEESINSYKSFAISKGYVESYIEKIAAIIRLERDFGEQRPTYSLSETQILLFKAMNKDTRKSMRLYDSLFEHVYKLKFNNVNEVVDKEKMIQVINLDAEHWNILEKEELIIFEILKFNSIETLRMQGKNESVRVEIL